MSRKSTKSQAAVERLLEERRQYEAWLAKLGDQDAAPAHVVDRVREDYRKRLEDVTRQLARYEGELEKALAETEVRRDQLMGQRASRTETLAEAELRTRVGEYDEARYAELSAEQNAALAQLAEEIAAAERDIARYEEVLGLIAGAIPEAAPAAAGPTFQAPAPTSAVTAAPEAPPVTPAHAAPPPDATPAKRTEPDAAELAKVASQIDALDELEFIRSVAAAQAGAEDTPPAPVEPPAAPAVPRGGEAPPVSALSDALPEPVERIVPEPPGKPAAKQSRLLRRTPEEADQSAKSLRCTECGTYNLPTEWYCEKCGAELSAF